MLKKDATFGEVDEVKAGGGVTYMESGRGFYQAEFPGIESIKQVEKVSALHLCKIIATNARR